jgi:tetratricopeptide (TPR) repeat protein
LEALQRLGQLVTQTIGVAGRTFDLELLESMPSLAPLAALSPALAVVQQNVESSRHLMSGRSIQARDGYLAVAKRLEEPDGAGLNPTHRRHMHLAVLFASGLIEANVGRPKALERAAAIEHEPIFSVSALRVRAIYALMQGDRASAEQYRTLTELLQIQNSPPQMFEGSQAMQWVFGYAALGDLLRVKQCLVDVEIMAREHPGWLPVVHGGRGAYQALRGDYQQAEQEFEQALALATVGRSMAWPFCASGLLWTLVRRERFADAVARGRRFLAAMEERGMHATMYSIQTALALAESSIGETEQALKHVHAAIDYLAAEGGSGVALGQAYEVRGYIALALNDALALREYSARCQEQYGIGKQPGLMARSDKLRRAGRRAGLLTGPRSVEMDASQLQGPDDVHTAVSTVFSTAQGPEERAERALQLLGRFTRCQGGFLYIMQRQGPTLVAQLGSVTPPLDIDNFVHKILLDALEQREVTQTEMSTSPEAKFLSTVTEGGRFIPVLLSHPGRDGMSITGVAIMSVPAKGTIRMPTRLIHSLSKALYDAGDAITQLTRELEGELPE